MTNRTDRYRVPVMKEKMIKSHKELQMHVDYILELSSFLDQDEARENDNESTVFEASIWYESNTNDSIPSIIQLLSQLHTDDIG